MKAPTTATKKTPYLSHCNPHLPTKNVDGRTITISSAKPYDRTGISDRAAVIIASPLLEDMGMVSPNDTFEVIDCSKFNREK